MNIKTIAIKDGWTVSGVWNNLWTSPEGIEYKEEDGPIPFPDYFNSHDAINRVIDKLSNTKFKAYCHALSSATNGNPQMAPTRKFLCASPEEKSNALLKVIEAAPAGMMRSPKEWERDTGVVVMDHGGWRDKEYDEEITKDEFLQRCCNSRCSWPHEVLSSLISEASVEYSPCENEASISNDFADNVMTNRFTFGKYKDKTYKEVLDEDPTYFMWAAINTKEVKKHVYSRLTAALK